MYCGTDKFGWDMFWAKRDGKPLTARQLRPFYHNFSCMMGIVNRPNQYRNYESGLSTLEVGAGRGIISSLFRQKGFSTFCTDIEDRLTYPFCHTFVKNDILESMPFTRNKFDITFTYGLLEHFKLCDRNIIMERCLAMTKPGGIVIHYVVPKKLMNYNEDKSVYRDRCKDLMVNVDLFLDYDNGGLKYVYPGLRCGADWECSKFLSKGFIWWGQKWGVMDKFVRDNVILDIERQLSRRNVILENIEE